MIDKNKAITKTEKKIKDKYYFWKTFISLKFRKNKCTKNLHFKFRNLLKSLEKKISKKLQQKK